MSSHPYKEPSWAVAPPKDSWSLLEIKGGVELATHSLTQSCTVLGRASDQIPLVHESCSRWHARIAFDKQGVPWLRDLKSAHGTTVNRKPLPAAAIGREESTSTKTGSRGVVLYPGDALQFGASTRMYILEGPPDYERGAIRKVVVESSPQHHETEVTSSPDRKTAEMKEPPQEQGISWGMNMEDAAIVDSAQAKRTLPSELDSSMIPDKHRKLWERLTTKKYKLMNVQRESERIRAKGEELSQGQEAQLQNNEKRIQKWQEEIEELEQELYEKLFPEKKDLIKKRHHHVKHEDEDVDDFYDRTKGSEDDDFDSARGETQESLTNKWRQHQSEWIHGRDTLGVARANVAKLEQRIQAADPNDEDTFFLQNDLDLAKDSLKKAQERNYTTERSLKETERLLRIVNADLEVDRETGFIGERGTAPIATKPVETPEADAVIMPPPPSPRASRRPTATPPEQASMPPPPRSPSSPEQASMLPPTLLSTSKEAMLPPPAKRKRILGPSMPPPAFDEGMPPPITNKRAAAAPIGTLSVLSAAASKAAPKPSKPRGESSKAGFDSKKDTWRAPDDQDGSGITKLNAKFAGRY